MSEEPSNSLYKNYADTGPHLPNLSPWQTIGYIILIGVFLIGAVLLMFSLPKHQTTPTTATITNQTATQPSIDDVIAKAKTNLPTVIKPDYKHAKKDISIYEDMIRIDISCPASIQAGTDMLIWPKPLTVKTVDDTIEVQPIVVNSQSPQLVWHADIPLTAGVESATYDTENILDEILDVQTSYLEQKKTDEEKAKTEQAVKQSETPKQSNQPQPTDECFVTSAYQYFHKSQDCPLFKEDMNRGESYDRTNVQRASTTLGFSACPECYSTE